MKIFNMVFYIKNTAQSITALNYGFIVEGLLQILGVILHGYQ